jgi:SynChlorMet cassette radical SAM/SPASM protein ScmE
MDFFDYVAEKKVLTTYISGGEPFVRNDIFDILDHISKKPMFVDGINTNATLIGRSEAQRLGNYKKIKLFSVSLDGSTPQIHDRVRGKGNFDRTIEGISNLIRYKNRVCTSTTVTKLNMNDIDNMLEIGKKLNIMTMKFSPVMILGNAVGNREEVGLSKRDITEILSKVPYWKKKYEGYFTGIFLDMFEMEQRGREDIATVKKDAPVRTFTGCKMLINKCVIRGDGWVIPCDRLWDMKAGNIRERDFLDIWNNSELFQQIRRKYDVPISIRPECKDCEYNRVCTGGCPAVKYELAGDIWGFDETSCYKFISECVNGKVK